MTELELLNIKHPRPFITPKTLSKLRISEPVDVSPKGWKQQAKENNERIAKKWNK